MRKIFLTIFIFIPIILLSKSLAPIGTSWWYNINFHSSPAVNYMKLEVTDSILMEGKICSKITQSGYYPDCSYYQISNNTDYIYKENNSVYLYDTQSTSFNKLADFNASINDTWTMNYAGHNIQVTVDSIDSISVLGEQFKQLHVTYLYDSTFETNATLVENILDLQNWFSFAAYEPSSCDMSSISGLRCYYNPDYGLYKTSTVDCDYTVEVSDAKSKNIGIQYQNQSLSIISPKENFTSVELITLDGKTLKANNNLNTSFYNEPINYSGILICIITLESGEQLSEKIITTK